MFHLDGYVWLNAGNCREDMIQDLLSSRPELTATRAHLQPAALILVIYLSGGLGSYQDDIALIGQVHITSITCLQIKVCGRGLGPIGMP